MNPDDFIADLSLIFAMHVKNAATAYSLSYAVAEFLLPSSVMSSAEESEILLSPRQPQSPQKKDPGYEPTVKKQKRKRKDFSGYVTMFLFLRIR